MIFARLIIRRPTLTTEVHKATLARLVLSEYAPTVGLFPTQHTLTLRSRARERFADLLEQHVMTEV